MPESSLAPVRRLPQTCCEQETRELARDCANQTLPPLSAEQRIEWVLQRLPGNFVLSSSFGAQAAVMLHLLTRAVPDIPVVLLDTGYLFPETYRFVDTLTEQLDLNLRVYRPILSAEWQEARHGQRWTGGQTGLQSYNEDNKVEPMSRALKELEANTWFSGLRNEQGASRKHLNVVELAGQGWKVQPIVDWTDHDVFRYLTKANLPYHPLWHKGYISIGDTHTTRSVHEVSDLEATRFFGLKRECGIHEMEFPA